MELSFLLEPYFFFPLLVWSLFWKAWALWIAGTRKEKTWFIILFILNTLGILEMIYIFTRKKSKKKIKELLLLF